MITLKVKNEKGCGLDVYKDTIFLCILAKNDQTFLKEFSTLIPGARPGNLLRPSFLFAFFVKKR